MITFPGLVLGGRYALTERLAVGGMGEVWSGTDTVLARPVAVKVLRTDVGSTGPLLARFRAEARTAAMLSHPGIAAMFDVREEPDVAYLVMELVPGEPLSAVIARDGALGTPRTLDLLAQIARALHAAHLRGVVHRDVKPANIMITPEGRAKVTDFGIARPQDHEPLTATGQVMGTAHYLAPEVARGQTATPAADVYALGIVAYECLAGWRPFDGVNQVAVATAHLHDQAPPLPETISAAVRDLVVRTMSKDPAGRPPSALALAEQAEALLRRRTTGAASGGSTPSSGPLAGPPAVLALGPRGWKDTAMLPVVPPEPEPEPEPEPSRGDPPAPRAERADARHVVQGRRGGRFRSPLVALLALLVFVAIGAAMTTEGDDSGRGMPNRTPTCAGHVGSPQKSGMTGPVVTSGTEDDCKGWIG